MDTRQQFLQQYFVTRVDAEEVTQPSTVQSTELVIETPEPQLSVTTEDGKVLTANLKKIKNKTT